MVDPDPLIQGLLGVATQAFGAAATWLVAAKAAKQTGETLLWYADTFQRQANKREALDHGKQLLGITGAGNYLYRHDNHHALYGPGQGLHPDNLAALLATGGSQFWRARKRGMAEIAPEVWGTLDQNLVLIGSPTSEGVSRIVFGFAARDNNSDELYRRTDAPLDLPYSMTLDRGDLAIGGTARRFVADRGAVARPNWRITGQIDSFVPETDREGWLQTDYLLVTRMPNFLSPSGLDQGHHIVSLAGTHGTATRAVECLVDDRNLLRALGSSKVGVGMTPFQAVFRVSGIRHDPVRGSYATRIELAAEPITISANFSTWEQASREVQPSLADLRAPSLDDMKPILREGASEVDQLDD